MFHSIGHDDYPVHKQTASSATGKATASAATPVAAYTWTLKDVLSAAYTLSSTKSASVVISGPGLLSTDRTTSSGAAKALALTSGSTGNFYLYGDGTSGVATITVTVGGTTLATKSFNFCSTTVASLTGTVNQSQVNVAAVTGFYRDSGTASGKDIYVSVVAKDASGNAIPSLTNLTATSSSTSVLTVGTPVWDSTDLVYYVPVTGVAAGTATVTVKDSTGTVATAALSLNVSKAIIDSWKLAFGSATYNAGDKATLLITAKDSAGSPVADGYYRNALSGAFTTSQALQSTLFGDTLHFVGGVATAKFYAPYFGGTLNADGYVGSSTTVLSAAMQAIAAAATVQSASTTINAIGGGDAALALDAANAATDAANNAYDEAQNATQAAQDALAAVTALAAQVKSLIASVKSLTALVSKIKAKVGA